MKTLSRSDLVARLSEHTGATFVGLTVVTGVRGTQYTKTSRINGTLGANYERSVRKATGDEDFTVSPRTWGTRVAKSPVIVHKGKSYLEVKVEKSLGHEFRLGADLVPEETVAPFLHHHDQPVVVRTYSFDAVTEITVGGETFHVVTG